MPGRKMHPGEEVGFVKVRRGCSLRKGVSGRLQRDASGRCFSEDLTDVSMQCMLVLGTRMFKAEGTGWSGHNSDASQEAGVTDRVSQKNNSLKEAHFF